MGIEYLDMTEDGVKNGYACSCFSNKPVTSRHVDRRPVKRIWADRCRDYRETSEDGKARAKCTADTRVRTKLENEETCPNL